jgi:penicillin amidase
MKSRTKLALVAVLLLVGIPVLGCYAVLRASLPPLDGARTVAGVVAPITIDRDHLGVVTLTAANRTDLAFATGYVHGQDRFFQMDLSRRAAAGELSELFGAVALKHDKAVRNFRFRHVARAGLAAADQEQLGLIDAYARGVNAGLASLQGRPWEYWLLGARPAPWLPEDTLLVSDAMWWDLQGGAFDREILRRQINERLRGPVCADGWKCALTFFYPARTGWDAPDDATAAVGSTPEASDIPGADVLDVRRASALAIASFRFDPASGSAALGSNNWAVAGRLTASGAALIANDMHLGQRVPPTWYRVRMRLAGTAATAPLDLSGVTLPGAPVLVAGSNGYIAWGFTNSYGTWFSLSDVPCTAIEAQLMRTTGASIPIERAREPIRIHHAAVIPYEVITSAAGVLIRADTAHHSCWFGAWLAQRPEATNLSLIQLEQAHSVDDAVALAPQIGIPHQNAVIGDRDGHIAWCIFGRIPVNTGADRAQAPVRWTTDSDHPHLIDPPLGRIWTANGRVTSDARQERLIGGELSTLGAQYDLGARAQQIRDDLLRIDHPATPADMLRVQLDDRAVFLDRWQSLLLRLLDTSALTGRPERAQYRELVANWNARASIDSAGYRLVRAYRLEVQQAVWHSLLAALGIPPEEPAPVPAQFEHALWLIVSNRPAHLLDPRYADWRQFLLSQLDATIDRLRQTCGSLEHCTWGARNTVAIRHPLSAAVPILSRLLDMPRVELPGDVDMPRVQDGTEGASERFAISPGREREGYFHMPGGQSGHPLSPYYRAGFMAWAQGQSLPFLPGAAEHRLTLAADAAPISRDGADQASPKR